MKNILLLLALFYSVTGIAQSPWYFGTGEAVNLTDAIKYKSGVRQVAGALDPTVTAVPGEAGSLYLSTSGNVYIKQDSGLSTNWNLVGAGGGGGGINSINGQSGPSVSIAVGTSGTNANVTATGNTVTVNLPTASATNRGLLSTTDWSDFNSKEDAVTAGTTAEYYRGDKSWQTLDKAAVGLGDVDNTSDLDKPVSTATQAALNLKADLASPTFTGDPKAPTPTVGDKDTSIATTAFVGGEIDAINANLPIIKPTLLLDFANSKTLDPRVTFERPSIRTCINAFGLIVSLAINEPCFDHDPETLESKGLLIEESRTNLLTHSNYFADSAWSKSGLTVIQNATTAPDGSLTASKLVVNNGQSLSGTLLHQTITKSPSPITYTLSVFAKDDGLNRIQFILNDSTNGSNNGSAIFSLLDGNLVGTAGAFGDFTSASASSKHYGNGVYRVWLTVTTNSSTGLRARITPRDSVITTGDGSLGLYIWGAQLEVGSFPTSYVPSTDTFTSRASTATYIGSDGLIKTAAINEARYSYNPNDLTIAPKLLLEPASENKLPYSDQFDNAAWVKGTGITVTANSTTAPDGTNTADTLTKDTSAFRAAYQVFTATIGSTYTFSAYVKQGSLSKVGLALTGDSLATINARYAFDLLTKEVTSRGSVAGSMAGITQMPGGYFRVSVTATLTSNSAPRAYIYPDDPSALSTTAGTIYVWGAQLEEGYLSSYIPTVASAVTRSADVSTSTATTRSADLASMTGTNFSSWYRQDEGTFVVKFFAFANFLTGTNVFNVSDGTNNNRIALALDSAPIKPRMYVVSSGVNTVSSALSTFTPNTPSTASLAFKVNDYGIVSGTESSYDSSSPIPSVHTLRIGATTAGAVTGAFHFPFVYFYPKRLTNLELQAVTK